MESRTKDRYPKALYRINGHDGDRSRALISYTIGELDVCLVDPIVFAVGHHAGDVIRWVARAELQHRVLFQDMPNNELMHKLREIGDIIDRQNILICNGDEVRFNFSIEDAMRNHLDSGAMFTAVVVKPENAVGNGMLFRVGIDSRVVDVAKRQEVSEHEHGWGKWLQHAGLMLIRRDALQVIDASQRDWDSGINLPALRAGILNAYIARDALFFNVNSADEIKKLEAHLASLRR
jgi:NDP-sugar pyrophosphorylase family protein